MVQFFLSKFASTMQNSSSICLLVQNDDLCRISLFLGLGLGLEVHNGTNTCIISLFLGLGLGLGLEIT